ncbi:MAG: hypothetical protein CVT49_10640 [candidate division Zixibacteria bacterium HGW-Zixibacteria-1]|nr:MAG: hypothetical protein CVT49_10640 [candidate division Zixibacteria bacterium HGW-Zixibacteria-1]
MKLKMIVVFTMLLMIAWATTSAQESPGTMETPDTVQVAPPPAPVKGLSAEDAPDDHGHAINLIWDESPDEEAGRKDFVGYMVYRADTPDGPFSVRSGLLVGVNSYKDAGALNEGDNDYMPDYQNYYYKVRALTIDSTVYSESEIFGPVQSYGQWFNWERLPVLLMVAGFLFLTIYFINRAKGGADLYVRRLAGIEAIDEAIGRATEMGKPILYVLGLGTAADIATIASYTILGRVAKKVAEYQTGLIVPCYDPIVMTVAQETVRTSYLDAGRPDAFNEDMVYFVTNQQFAYVAGVNGVMLRERPATNLYMGKFYAESLILAETGVVAGSIQISGTDEISQIPFFVVACDYTLIGEELYAASAYLGKEPLLLGSLKAQDYAKAAVIILTVIGLVSLMLGYQGFAEFFHVTG